MIEVTYTNPIAIFWSNLSKMGVKIWAENNQLQVRAAKPELLTPVLKKEIERRAALLIEFLQKSPSTPDISNEGAK